MAELQRPLTVYFSTRAIRQLKESEVMESLADSINIEQVKGIQVTPRECRVTLSTAETKQQLKASGINLRNQHVRMQDADKTVLNVTVKDGPIEMNDAAIASALQAYGTVVQGSIRRGKIRGTEIETGTRYLSMVNVEEDEYIPRTLDIGRFTLRVFCDHNAPQSRRCYRCLSTDHVVKDCPESDTVCAYCGQTGHKRKDCVDYQELELGRHMEHQRRDEQEIESLWGNKEEGVIPLPDVPTAEVESIQDKEDLPAADAHNNTDEQTAEQPDALILGASIVKHLDLSPGAVVVAESGTTASSVEKLFDAARSKVEQESVRTIVVHLGTNDNTQHKGDAESVKLNMADCVAKVQLEYPEAQVCVASIPPRKGKSASILAFNSQADSVNTFLQKLAGRSEGVDFLDTTRELAPGGHPTKRFYSDNDPSGVHLSPTGQQKLKDIFQDYLGSESRKRYRSSASSTSSTPSSVEKQAKKGKVDTV